MKFDGML